MQQGMEYATYQPFILRASYSYDPSPVPASMLDPQLCDPNRHMVSAGIGTSGRHGALDAHNVHFSGQSCSTTTSIHASPTNGSTGMCD